MESFETYPDTRNVKQVKWSKGTVQCSSWHLTLIIWNLQKEEKLALPRCVHLDGCQSDACNWMPIGSLRRPCGKA